MVPVTIIRYELNVPLHWVSFGSFEAWGSAETLHPGSLVRDESLIEKRWLYSKVEWSGLLERWNIAMAIWDDCERTLDGRLEHWIAHLLPYTRLAPRHWIVNTTNWLECYGPRTPLLDCLCSTLHTVISLGYRCNAKHIIVLQFSNVCILVQWCIVFLLCCVVCVCCVCLLDGGWTRPLDGISTHRQSWKKQKATDSRISKLKIIKESPTKFSRTKIIPMQDFLHFCCMSPRVRKTWADESVIL